MAKRVPEEAQIIGKNLRKFRNSIGLTQTEMGKILGISFQQVQKYENGRNRFPVEKLHKLHSILGIAYEQVFAGLKQERYENSYSPYPQSSVLHSVYCLEDINLKRKIEKVIEIMLS